MNIRMSVLFPNRSWLRLKKTKNKLALIHGQVCLEIAIILPMGYFRIGHDLR